MLLDKIIKIKILREMNEIIVFTGDTLIEATSHVIVLRGEEMEKVTEENVEYYVVQYFLGNIRGGRVWNKK